MLEISLRQAGDVRVVDVRGRVTIGDSSDRLNEQLHALHEQGWRKILVNLAGVQQIDSSGLATLVRNSLSFSRAGGSLRLLCAQGRVLDALSVTRLSEAIPTYRDEATALASFDGA